jgi:hypothetical protein
VVVLAPVQEVSPKEELTEKDTSGLIPLQESGVAAKVAESKVATSLILLSLILLFAHGDEV